MFKKIRFLMARKLAEESFPAEWLAKIHDAEVTLIRVALAHTFPGMDPVQHQVNVVREAEEYLAKVEANLKSVGVKVKFVVRYGNDAQEIVDHARDRDFDLITMSTHGRTGLAQFVLGSGPTRSSTRRPCPFCCAGSARKSAGERRAGSRFVGPEGVGVVLGVRVGVGSRCGFVNRPSEASSPFNILSSFQSTGSPHLLPGFRLEEKVATCQTEKEEVLVIPRPFAVSDDFVDPASLNHCRDWRPSADFSVSRVLWARWPRDRRYPSWRETSCRMSKVFSC
jgi:nucleotide-binding universal stress UspA family protein